MKRAGISTTASRNLDASLESALSEPSGPNEETVREGSPSPSVAGSSKRSESRQRDGDHHDENDDEDEEGAGEALPPLSPGDSSKSEKSDS